MIALTAHLQSELNALNDALLMASISEEPLSPSDVDVLAASAMSLLQNICAHHIQSDVPDSVAAVDVFSLCCASLDYLHGSSDSNLDTETKVATLSALFLPMADTEGAGSVELAMDWLQREDAVELLDSEERERIAYALLQTVDKPADNIVLEVEAEIETETETETDIAPANTHDLAEDQLEILDLLSAELEDMQNQQSSFLTSLNKFVGSDEKHILLSLASRHEHLANVCGMVNLLGLQLYFGHLQNNFEYLAEQENWLNGVEHLLAASLNFSRQYIASQLDRQAGTLLLDNWVDSGWPLAMPEDAHLMASEALLNADMGALEDERPPRKTLASIEDVTLVVPDDVNSELLESLLQELPEQTAEMSAALQSCIKNKFMDDLDTARRIAHTLKGAANVVGIRGVANMTHQMEDILDILFKYNTVATGSLADVLLATADCLEGMCETLLGQGDAPEDAVLVLQQILDWANHLDAGGKAAIEKMASEAPAATPVVTQELSEENADKPVESRSAQMVTQSKDKSEAEEEQRSLRISYSLIDELMRLAGEHTILSGQIQEHTGNAVKHMHGVKQRSQYLHNLTQELEQLVDVRRVGGGRQQETSDNFDPLEMEEYNELHTVTHRLVEAVNDVYEHMDSIERELQSLSDANVDQGRMNGQQQEVVMQTRMVPVQSVVPRLQRSVRQACRLASKQIELDVEGANTLIDNDILSSLIDPIMHLLRNAVDHGMEDTEERARANKSAEAVIKLSFTRRGDQIVVACKDDGRGLDYERIESKALERNLLQAGQEYSREELAHIILSPGFSTRDEVTQLSGRGVGMDVVNSEVVRLKGVLNVRSVPHEGTRFEIILPTSLLAAHALLVKVAEQTFVVTSHGVNEVLFAGEGELQYLGEEMVYRSGEDVLKVTTLASLLNMPVTEVNINNHHVLMLVEANLGRKVAVLIDEVVDSRDIVIKPLGSWFSKTPGVVGATILGDGSAVAVLDLPGLARTEAHTQGSSSISMGDKAAQNKVSILVVDDSLSTRRSLSQFVEDMGVAVETAKDGMEAVESIRRHKPTLVLADMEMPRMNGLELTSHIRSQPETHDLPVIMITSRATDKHRQLAMEAGVTEYLNKPYSEEQLLQLIHSHLQQG